MNNGHLGHRSFRWAAALLLLILLPGQLWAIDAATERRVMDLAYRDPAAALQALDQIDHDSAVPAELAAIELLRGVSLYYAGDFSGSLRKLTAAEPDLDADQHPQRSLVLLRWRAQNYFRLAAFQDALPVALSAVELAESLDDKTNLAQLFNVVAAIRLRTGDHQDALKYFLKAEALFSALNMAQDRAKVLNNIAATYIETGQFDLAERPLISALQAGRALDRPTTVLASLVNLIELRAKQGRVADALAAVDECFASEQADAERRAKLWCHDSAVFATQAAGDLDASIAHAKLAVEQAQLLGLQSELIDNAGRLREMLTEKGDLSRALYYAQVVTSATEKLNNGLMSSRIEQIEALNAARQDALALEALRLQETLRVRTIWALVAGGALMLLFLIWVTRSLRAKSALVGTLNRVQQDLRGSLAATEAAKADNERLAHTDSLTGIANRRAFVKFAEGFHQSADVAAGGLAIVDVDHFKRVNDQYGHDVGDQILQAICGRLQNQLSDVSGIVARLGGEEFAVLCEIGGESSLLDFGERLRAHVGDSPILVGGDAGLRLSVTISVGLCLWTEGDLDSALKATDNALYEAKSGGRNCVRSAAVTGSL